MLRQRGRVIMNFPTVHIEKYLSNLMTFNPFDAVFILKQQEVGKYFVELMNAKAEVISSKPLQKRMNAEDFFDFFYWNELIKFIQEPNQSLQYIVTKNKRHKFYIFAKQLIIENHQFYVLVLRPSIEETVTFLDYTFYHDLTDLPNRRALNLQWLEKYINEENGNIALLLIDIDRFKKYNESLGKQKTDRLLKQISERMKQFSNDHCSLYHYGEDEFIFIVRFHFREEIELVANNILNSLKQSFSIEEQDYFVTASIGISIANERCNLESVLLKAEHALLYVKNHGRSHYRFYREEMDHGFQNEVLMEAHLRRAIELQELSIHLQPQIDFTTKTIDSFEALLRWENPKFGNVSPGQFIPLAESSGLIIQIGDWVLEQVCRYQQHWRNQGYRPVRIAVNISPPQFKQEDFIDKIEVLLEKYDINPEYLELEITESSMVNVEETEEILKRIKALGLYVSVDDFGTGYSSLSYLKKYPIDIIKIDQSFIADINKDEKNEAIIKAIITLSKNLGMDVIAEGVEAEDQELFLKLHQCQKGQGYLYNKPLPVEKMVEKYLVNEN